MTLSSNTPHKKARIEIIPLIDIMFFLLASFMLVSMSMIKLQKVESKLPGINKAPPPTDRKDFTVIGIDAKGDIYFDKDEKPIKADVIPGRLQPVVKAQGDNTTIFINADKDAKYDDMMAVLDAVRSLGISKVSFPVKKDNTFDPAKPRPNTHVTGPVGAPAAPAAPGAPAPAAPPPAP